MAELWKSFRMLVRKLTAAMAFLLITGIIPAMGSLGFCATRPCCQPHRQPGAAIGTHPACCTEENCSISAPATSEFTQLTKHTIVQTRPVAVVAEPSAVPPAPMMIRERDALHIGSPPTQQRLATLSMLVI